MQQSGRGERTVGPFRLTLRRNQTRPGHAEPNRWLTRPVGDWVGPARPTLRRYQARPGHAEVDRRLARPVGLPCGPNSYVIT
jgi:hypothetical protein